ncbi:MAG: leucine-rich repeat domain-containing protein [Candidatus Paceibacterota bacterium]|jgi:Leucine-rich repeat (LRR) protein
MWGSYRLSESYASAPTNWRTSPPQIYNLSSLQELILRNNQLANLPPQIGHLSSLVWLNLGGNQLASLPSPFFPTAAKENFPSAPVNCGSVTIA